MKKITTIDDYIGNFPKEIQHSLQQIRQSVKEISPQAEEKISYAMPAFNLNKRNLIYFAAWKNHMSIYPITDDIKENFKKDLTKYEMSKGTLKFALDKPLPINLIKRIVKYKVKQNIDKIKSKK